MGKRRIHRSVGLVHILLFAMVGCYSPPFACLTTAAPSSSGPFTVPAAETAPSPGQAGYHVVVDQPGCGVQEYCFPLTKATRVLDALSYLKCIPDFPAQVSVWLQPVHRCAKDDRYRECLPVDLADLISGRDMGTNFPLSETSWLYISVNDTAWPWKLAFLLTKPRYKGVEEARDTVWWTAVATPYLAAGRQ